MAASMKIYFLTVLYFIVVTHVSGRHFASKSTKRCLPELEIEWSRELSTAPFASQPLVTDVDGDGSLDVIAASFSGDVHVVRAKDGKSLPNWPYRLPQSSVHASPIQHDFDDDGFLDILICTSQGALFVLSPWGQLMTSKEYQLDGIYVQRDWYQRQLSADEHNIHDFILDGIPDEKAMRSYVQVDPHILATPVLTDINQDNVFEELIISVSYFFDLETYSNPEFFDKLSGMLTFKELENFVVSTVLVFNITNMQPLKSIHLELTKADARYPGYLLSSPVISRLDSSSSQLHIIVGTSAGSLHVLDQNGKPRQGFPIPLDVLQSEVTVADLDRDGKTDIIVVDIHGNIACYHANGTLMWDGEVSGTAPTQPLVVDVDGDGLVDVVYAANDGKVWALSGQTGVPLSGWPQGAGTHTHAAPTLLYNYGQPVILSLASDGHIHLLRGDAKCRYAFNLGETSFVSLLSHDLLVKRPGTELLVATEDGTLLLLAAAREVSERHSLPQNFYTTIQYALSVINWPEHPKEVSGPTFGLQFNIMDNTFYKTSPFYSIKISMGSKVLLQQRVYGGSLSLTVPSLDHPAHGHLLLRCTAPSGRVTSTTLPIRFYMNVLADMQWLLVTPSLGMVILLLFLHAFPDTDILPVHMKTI